MKLGPAHGRGQPWVHPRTTLFSPLKICVGLITQRIVELLRIHVNFFFVSSTHKRHNDTSMAPAGLPQWLFVDSTQSFAVGPPTTAMDSIDISSRELDIFPMFFSVHATTQRIMAPAATSCHACGKSGCKLLRCGRCRNAWFCNRVCQVVAARQGHSGANCCPADKAPTPATEVTLRLPAAAGPSTTAPGVIPASLVSAATSCHACGKSAGRLLLCGRCRNAWFCNRECQVIARQELGHTGANCRSAAGVQQSFSADPSQVSTPADAAKLALCYRDLITEANEAQMTNTRIGLLAAVEKGREAASVTDLIGGAKGAFCRADTDQLISSWLTRLGDMAAAALAASSSLRAARASSNRTMLVIGLISCGKVATIAPGEMANAERASREQERINGYPVSYGGLDLSHEGRISLPTTPAALSRLGLAYNEAAVGICDANRESFPDVCTEAQARGSLGLCLYNLGEERQRS